MLFTEFLLLWLEAVCGDDTLDRNQMPPQCHPSRDRKVSRECIQDPKRDSSSHLPCLQRSHATDHKSELVQKDFPGSHNFFFVFFLIKIIGVT